MKISANFKRTQVVSLKRVGMQFLGSFMVLFMVFTMGCTKKKKQSQQALSVPLSSAAGPQAKSKDWCAGHGVPESKCTICHPELIAKYQKSGDWCKEHRLPESVCPKCNPGLLKKTIHRKAKVSKRRRTSTK